MINLAGVKEADKTIKEELYLAGIDQHNEISNGEVPFTIIGKVGNWKFTRAWCYWVAKVEHTKNGLPLRRAVTLHNMPNPIDMSAKLGESIRAGGDGSGPLNGYVAQPDDEELSAELKKLGLYKEVQIGGKMYGPNISLGEIATLCNEGKINLERYVDCYHIDDQIGLNEFAKFLKELK